MKKVITVLIIFAFITNLKAEKPIEKKKLIAINNSKPMNWFTDVLDGIASLWQPVWGHYTEDGFRSEGPYFLFDRKLEEPTYVQIQMQQVQEKIK